ncbi:MAG TPA: hypothetical protein VHA33_06165 [Candidatus Angelobacter sp.]|jgi:hypothetical protein|nr:hypothetical protein [Candidatus Angelobacter sp.]
MRNKRIQNCVSRLPAAWLLLLICSAPLLIWGQSDGVDQRACMPQLQGHPSSSNAGSTAPAESKSNSSERIFGIVPAYNITDARNAPPLTAEQKFGLFAKAALDPFPVAAYAVQAGVSQATDTHAGYGQGLGGYGKRFGAALLDGTSARFFGTYAFPSLLHQDPRYFRKGDGSAWSRVGYSLTRSFVTRADSGKRQPNWSNVFGKFTSAGLSNLYYPAEDRGGNLTLTRVAISLSYQTLGNFAIEFWPEIHRKLSGGNKPK